jgi:hypothetical protein
MKQEANIADLLLEGQDLCKFGGIYLYTNEDASCVTSLCYFYLSDKDITADYILL